jgi:hypothetical protein
MVMILNIIVTEKSPSLTKQLILVIHAEDAIFGEILTLLFKRLRYRRF